MKFKVWDRVRKKYHKEITGTVWKVCVSAAFHPYVVEWDLKEGRSLAHHTEDELELVGPTAVDAYGVEIKVGDWVEVVNKACKLPVGTVEKVTSISSCGDFVRILNKTSGNRGKNFKKIPPTTTVKEKVNAYNKALESLERAAAALRELDKKSFKIDLERDAAGIAYSDEGVWLRSYLRVAPTAKFESFTMESGHKVELVGDSEIKIGCRTYDIDSITVCLRDVVKRGKPRSSQLTHQTASYYQEIECSKDGIWHMSEKISWKDAEMLLERLERYLDEKR